MDWFLHDYITSLLLNKCLLSLQMSITILPQFTGVMDHHYYKRFKFLYYYLQTLLHYYYFYIITSIITPLPPITTNYFHNLQW
jgi:hypothetical protein